MSKADEPRKRPGRTRSAEPEAVRTLERGLIVLRVLGEQSAATLSEVARFAGLSASTTYRLLQTLRQQGFAHEEAGIWQVGIQTFVTGRAYAELDGLVAAAKRQMESLVAETGETVNLAVLQAPDVMYVHQVEGRGLMRMFTQIGARSPLYCTGAGKALLAWRDESDLADLVGAGPYPAFTERTLTSLAAYQAELAEVRQLGYALDNEEREDGVRCVAVPIYGAGGTVTAAMSLSAPASRLGDERVGELAATLQAAAREIAVRLGGQRA
ncbi:IclR family transcriptional regulator (plasmid) [Deinococcus psychrotolerans]|uniref:IclR family transcriptional regulator n=2 Tax=Deinococcus psychrotolerans TaxID=2489213 RepID=A0A3G8YIF6_9DEIO|nr:IclR family transcriptional regulator [Deinococcus psychrotolerans]